MVARVSKAQMYFAATDSSGKTNLWVTDGTAAGTSLISVPLVGVSSLYPTSFAALGSKVFFAGFDGATKDNLFVVDSATNAVTELKAAAFR